jgi:hypothetical protein
MMPEYVKTRSDRRYSDERAMFKGVARQNNTPCWLCGKPIDYKAAETWLSTNTQQLRTRPRTTPQYAS